MAYALGMGYSLHMKTNRRAQSPKPGRNEPLMRAMQDKRFSNAAGPIKPKTAYRRKPKHGDWS